MGKGAPSFTARTPSRSAVAVRFPRKLFEGLKQTCARVSMRLWHYRSQTPEPSSRPEVCKALASSALRLGEGSEWIWEGLVENSPGLTIFFENTLEFSSCEAVA